MIEAKEINEVGKLLSKVESEIKDLSNRLQRIRWYSIKQYNHSEEDKCNFCITNKSKQEIIEGKVCYNAIFCIFSEKTDEWKD